MPSEDNRENAPARLFGVAEQPAPEPSHLTGPQVAEMVGRALGDQAARVRPTGADLAGMAIRQARRVQRRRRVAGLAAVVLATVSVSGALLVGLSESGEVHHRDGPFAGLFRDDGDRDSPASAGPPDEPTRDVSLAADEAMVERVEGGLVGEGDHEGLVLATDDGVLADLGPIRDVSSVHRVSHGWVVVTTDASAARLWWVTDGGKPRVVLSGLDEIVTDGTRVAWRLGSRVSTGALDSDGSLDRQADYEATAGEMRPAGFLGGAVLLQRTTGGGAVSWALWQPDECAVGSCADFDPVWNQGVLRVYGAEPGGQVAIGLVPAVSKDQGVCLARLRIADDLPVLARVCPRGLPSTGPASLSPDGRWLIATSGGATGAVVVDVAAAFDGDPAAVLPVDTAAKPVAVPVWSAPEEAVYPAEDRLVWVRPGRVKDGAEDAVVEAELSGALPTLVQLSR